MEGTDEGDRSIGRRLSLRSLDIDPHPIERRSPVTGFSLEFLFQVSVSTVTVDLFVLFLGFWFPEPSLSFWFTLPYHQSLLSIS